MTVKGVIFILNDVQERRTNEVALRSVDTDYVFHREYAVHHPTLIRTAYKVGRAEGIPTVLDLIAKERFSCAIYTLDAQKVEKQLRDAQIPYVRRDSGRTIIYASPNSDQRHEISIFSVYSLAS